MATADVPTSGRRVKESHMSPLPAPVQMGRRPKNVLVQCTVYPAFNHPSQKYGSTISRIVGTSGKQLAYYIVRLMTVIVGD